MNPLYDTAISIRTDLDPVKFHLETISEMEKLIMISRTEIDETIILSEKFDELNHNLQKLRGYIKINNNEK